MKKTIVLSFIAAFFTLSVSAQQDKSKRPSPPAVAKETTASGLTIMIDYSQPSLKGRAIGTELAPYGKVWRAGANEATIFEISKNAKVEGKALPAGKYALHAIPGEKEWVFIFNKKWQKPGTEYNEAENALQVSVRPEKSSAATEKMTFTISKAGKVTLLWGNLAVPFNVK
ncbi:DUF2911 domain-containing protein [Pedobacter deserti]|uniref:DUF2911 domain-containing protein n=1 Tax=Pedobacter deserti TaxID=2817382 RepID=UPI002109924B|nr:DUF2911 domain-containing protein [Pedobacter sp. SYSU D00382]